MSQKNGLADPTRLKPFDSNDKKMLRVVIETPKGNRNKFAVNPDEHVFELKKVLPSGMTPTTLDSFLQLKRIATTQAY